MLKELELAEVPLKGKAAPLPDCSLTWNLSALQHCSDDCQNEEEAPGDHMTLWNKGMLPGSQ